jgi:uncharacterized protein YutE (UPF0331/DUF86 family)
MSLDRAVEEIIQAAMARGEFDDLPGKGKPLDLDSYFAAPEDLRMAFSVLRNAGYLPEEVQLLKDVAALRDRLAATDDEDEKEKLRRAIQDKTVAFRMLVEKYRSRRPARR